MAGLTKEQRAAKKAEEEKQMREAIRADLEREFNEKFEKEKAKLIDKSNNFVSTNIVKSQHKIEIPTNTMIPVMSGVNGGLTYVSRKTYGYEVDWENRGDIEYIEYGELVSMRNTQRSFFEKNWILIQDSSDYLASDVYKALSVEKYYNSIILGEDIDELFTLTPDEIKERILKAPASVRENIASIAKAKIDSGELDSMNRIKAIEEATGLTFSPTF